MATGFERRDVIDDANAKSRSLEPNSIPVPGVTGPRGANFSRVGEAERQLAEALGNANVGLTNYVQKKSKTWELEGQMARARGVTEEEINKTGNRFSQAGWQAMNGKIAQDQVKENELSFIQSEGKMMTPEAYQARLMKMMEENDKAMGKADESTRNMLYAGAAEMFPQLIAQQTRLHNEYNKEQTLDKGRKMLVTTSEADGPEVASEYLDRKLYGNMNDVEYSSMVAQALQDSYELGSNKLEQAIGLGKAVPGTSVLRTDKNAGVPAVKNILNLIGQAESTNNYNAVFGGENPNLTTMTIDQVLAMQSEKIAQGAPSVAAGKYQIINSTLQGLKSTMGLTGNEVFDEKMQDQFALQLLEARGLSKFLAGEMSPASFQAAIAQEWAGIPKDNSGLSHYDGDGLNKATVEPGMVLAALGADQSGMGLYEKLKSMGMQSDDITRVVKARDAYQSEQSSKFDAARLLTEQKVAAAAIDLTDEQLISTIKTAKEAGGYSDAWANSLWSSSLSKRAADIKERAKTTRIQSLISTNSVQQGTKDEQQKAIDMVAAQALKSVPEGADPAAAQQEVYKFMYANQITDDRLKSQWEVATTGDIIDGNGKLKPAALAAYTSYRQAAQSTNDPQWAQSLLSEKTKDIFLMADSYLGGDTADVGPALAAASSFVQKQNAAKNMMSVPWWKDLPATMNVEAKLQNQILPGLFDGVYGLMGSTQTQMRWSIADESVQRATKSPEVMNRVKMEAASLWNSYKHWDDQGAAQDLALAKATNKVIKGSEYVAGTLVYTGDQPSLSERFGMPGRNNAANLVVSRVMSRLGPSIWEDFNKTDYVPHSQTWYEQDPGLGKLADGIVDVGHEVIYGSIFGAVRDKAGEKMRGIPDFNVVMNPSGNALVLSPYKNYDRTQTDMPIVLSVEDLAEAASFINKKDDAGFDKWVERMKTKVPNYTNNY